MKWKKTTTGREGQEVFFTYGDRLEVYQAIIKKGYTLSPQDKEDLTGNAEGVAVRLLYKGEVDSFLMWLPKQPITNGELSAMFHEVIHLAGFIWHEIGGAGVTMENDEPFCYLAEEIAEDALKFYR